MVDHSHPLAGTGSVVVGGASPLGAAIVDALRAAGSSVVVIDAAKPNVPADETAGTPAAFVEADIRDPEEVREAFAQADLNLPSLNATVIVPEAAGAAGPAEAIPAAAWDEVLDRQLNGVFWVCQQAARRMLASDGGAIVAISSLAGVLVDKFDQRAHHHAANAAIDTLAKGLAVEWGPHGVRVNTVAPGAFGDITHAGTVVDDAERVTRATPMNRLGRVDDVVPLVTFLCSPSAAYITGQTLVADGGRGLLFD